MTFIDQLNRTIHLKNTPKRIISLVPSQTELLYDLGLEHHIVGITKFCVHPLHLRREKTIVGGTKQVKIEVVKDLQPDIILCNKEENSLEILQQMEQIAPVHMSDVYTLQDSFDLIRGYGKMFSCDAKALAINNGIQNSVKEFQQFILDKPKLSVVYFIWRNPWMVAAKNTFINHLLELNKFENCYAHLERYPEINIEKMCIDENPDVILLSSEPFPFKSIHIEDFKPFIKHSKIIFVDGEYFSWYGSRLKKAFTYFKQLREESI